MPFDSIAAPFVDTSSAQNFALFGVLKMIRLFRLNKIIMYLNVKKDIKDTIRFFKVIFFLLMYIHFVGCIWFFIINFDKTWMPSYDIFDGIEKRGKFFELDDATTYVISFYNSCLFLFGSESFATNNFQVVFTIVMNLFGAVIQGNMFGELADLIYSINKEQII